MPFQFFISDFQVLKIVSWLNLTIILVLCLPKIKANNDIQTWFCFKKSYFGAFHLKFKCNYMVYNWLKYCGQSKHLESLLNFPLVISKSDSLKLLRGAKHVSGTLRPYTKKSVFPLVVTNYTLYLDFKLCSVRKSLTFQLI